MNRKNNKNDTASRKNRYPRKRLPTFSGPNYNKRRKLEIVPPTRFLLGGNIKDPLNLNSLQDEEINRAVNAVTPICSPIPTPPNKKLKIEVFIPENVHDPLNLMTEKKRKRRSRKRRRTETPSKENSDLTVTGRLPHNPMLRRLQIDLDKIVSPVVPQPGAWNKRAQFSSLRPKKTKEIAKPNFREEDKQFQYGNYNRYYGYRLSTIDKDPRLIILQYYKSMFKDKDVLDIGCNVGYVTLTIASSFDVKQIVGIDIDDKLVQAAKKNIRHYITHDPKSSTADSYPISMPIMYGPANKSDNLCKTNLPFPHNVHFMCENYVLNDDKTNQVDMYDIVLCLSLTKWIHLNWGDDGLKKCFRKIFQQLRSGGKLILETQSWHSYKKKKKLTETIYNNYKNIKFYPKKFNQYLLSSEVGFAKSEILGWPQNVTRGFLRPLRVYTKSVQSLESVN